MKKRLLLIGAILISTSVTLAQDVTNGLLAKYTFDQDSIQDEVGTNNGATSEVLYTSGYGGAGKSIYFDGYDGSQAATVSRGLIEDSILPFDQDLTISFWFNVEAFNAPNTLNMLTSRRTISGGEAGGIEIIVSGFGTHQLQVAGRSISGGLTNEYILSSAVLSEGQWYFATFTQSGTVKKLYLNGSEVDEDLTPNLAEQNNIWAVGSSRRFNEADREFHGEIDEVRFYDRALSAQEVTQLYNYNPSTAGLDLNTLNNAIRIYPNPAQDIMSFSSDANVQQINIINTLGELVYTSTKTNNIDVSDLKRGVYIIRFTLENDQVLTKRFIKN